MGLNGQQKLELFHELCSKYHRLTPLGMALVGFDIRQKLEDLMNSPELSFMKEWLELEIEIY